MSEVPRSDFDRRLPALLAAVGLLCSALLEFAHYQAYIDPARTSFCRAGAGLDCATVALSSWSVFLGVPLPFWGAAGFLTIAVLAWWRSTWLLPVTGFAALLSVLLFLVELLSIHSVCLLCEGVHVTALGLFALTWRGRRALVETNRVALAQLFSTTLSIPICAYLMLAPYWAIFSWRSGVHLPTGVDEHGRHWIGATDPKVTVHEYVDYSCPHCAVATHHTQLLLARHTTTLRLVRHEYPRMRCPKTPDMSHCVYTRAALCAGDQGVFWQADSWLFEHGTGRASVDFHKAAKDLGIDYDKLSACMETQQAFDRAMAEADDAAANHVIDAPSYVINGKKYVGGEAFAALNALL